MFKIAKVKTDEKGKMSIEQRQYDIFSNRFKNGGFGTQRFGQAFYDHFKLGLLKDQSKVGNIYAKDGEHAKRSIAAIFDFT